MKFPGILLPIAILFLIYPSHSAAQQKKQEASAAIGALLEVAKKGDAKSQVDLAKAYLSGLGVQQNFVEAAKWYRKAANQGNAESQGELAYMYYKGQGIPQDYAQAAFWARKGADQGDANAQSALGVLYYEGSGVPQDYAKAAKWYRKAADQGYAKAQYNLGNMYYAGTGVKQDYIQAHMWTNLSTAGLKGKQQEIATVLRGMIAKKMTPQQISEAQGLAREWKPKLAK